MDTDDYEGMSIAERLVWGLIREREGRGAAVSVEWLCNRTEMGNFALRKIVKDLIEFFHKPIGSVTQEPAGYFVIVSEEERRKVRNSLIHRAVSILNRAKVFDRSGLAERLAGQVELEDRIKDKGG